MYRVLIAASFAAMSCAVALAHPGHDDPTHLLVAGWTSSNIIAYHAGDGDFDSTFVESGFGGLSNAHSITLGPDDHLYLASNGSNAVLAYDLEGNFLGEFATHPSLNGPADAIFSPINEDLYVSSLPGSSVFRFDGETGDFISVHVTAGSGGLNGGEMMAFGNDGNLYVASGNGNAIMRYDLETGVPLPGPLGAAGTAQFVTPNSGGLSNPHDIEFGPDGHLYAASFGSNQVLKYNGETGAFMEVFSGTTSVPGAHGITFDQNDNFFIEAFFSSTVMQFEADGTFVGVFAQGGGLFAAAHAVFVDLTPDNPADIDEDGVVGPADLAQLLGAWGPCPRDTACTGDLNEDGTVGPADLALLLGAWG